MVETEVVRQAREERERQASLDRGKDIASASCLPTQVVNIKSIRTHVPTVLSLSDSNYDQWRELFLTTLENDLKFRFIFALATKAGKIVEPELGQHLF